MTVLIKYRKPRCLNTTHNFADSSDIVKNLDIYIKRIGTDMVTIFDAPTNGGLIKMKNRFLAFLAADLVID